MKELQKYPKVFQAESWVNGRRSKWKPNFSFSFSKKKQFFLKASVLSLKEASHWKAFQSLESSVRSAVRLTVRSTVRHTVWVPHCGPFGPLNASSAESSSGLREDLRMHSIPKISLCAAEKNLQRSISCCLGTEWSGEKSYAKFFEIFYFFWFVLTENTKSESFVDIF